MAVRFSRQSVFAMVASIATLCATSAWLMSRVGYEMFSKVPPPFPIPPHEMLMPCLALAPFYCLPMLIVMGVLILFSSPRAYSATVFFGLQFLVFAMDVSYWGNGARLLFAMLLSATAMLIEAYARNLPRRQWIAGGIAISITAAWYLAIVAVIVMASC